MAKKFQRNYPSKTTGLPSEKIQERPPVIRIEKIKIETGQVITRKIRREAKTKAN